MASVLYLAYGSNLLPRRLRARTASARLAGTIGLPGWSLRFHKRGQDGSAKCNLVPTGRSADMAYGAVFEIPEAERSRLDTAEGLGKGYELEWLEMDGFGRLFLYLAAPSHIEDGLRPFSWYKALVAAGAAYHGFPEDYVACIRQLAACEDPDPERHRRHLSLLEDHGSGGTRSPARGTVST